MLTDALFTSTDNDTRSRAEAEVRRMRDEDVVSTRILSLGGPLDALLGPKRLGLVRLYLGEFTETRSFDSFFNRNISTTDDIILSTKFELLIDTSMRGHLYPFVSHRSLYLTTAFPCLDQAYRHASQGDLRRGQH